MTHIPDLSPNCYWSDIADPYEDLPNLLSVGYLGNDVPTTGKTDEALLEKLEYLRLFNKAGGGEMGLHTCEICDDYDDGGGFVVFGGSANYLLSAMVVHYIREHDYALPEKVKAAVEKVVVPFPREEFEPRYEEQWMRRHCYEQGLDVLAFSADEVVVHPRGKVLSERDQELLKFVLNRKIRIG